jgi:hypothetical protein
MPFSNWRAMESFAKYIQKNFPSTEIDNANDQFRGWVDGELRKTSKLENSDYGMFGLAPKSYDEAMSRKTYLPEYYKKYKEVKKSIERMVMEELQKISVVQAMKPKLVFNDKEIGEKSFYLAFERLDTKKFEDFYSTMQEVFNTYATDEIKELWEINRYSDEINYFFSIIFEIATNPNKDKVVDVFHTMNPIIERESPQYYSDYLNFVDLLYKITTLEEYDSDAYWDFNSGNFGYDKNGKIKSLDI